MASPSSRGNSYRVSGVGLFCDQGCFLVYSFSSSGQLDGGKEKQDDTFQDNTSFYSGCCYGGGGCCGLCLRRFNNRCCGNNRSWTGFYLLYHRSFSWDFMACTCFNNGSLDNSGHGTSYNCKIYNSVNSCCSGHTSDGYPYAGSSSIHSVFWGNCRCYSSRSPRCLCRSGYCRFKCNENGFCSSWPGYCRFYCSVYVRL